MSWDLMGLFINTKDSIIFCYVLRFLSSKIHFLAQTVVFIDPSVKAAFRVADIGRYYD